MEGGKNIIFEVSSLIFKKLAGTISSEEAFELKKWRDKSDKNAKLYDDICSDDVMRSKIHTYLKSDVDKAFHNFLLKREKLYRRRRIFRFVRYAAIFILPLALGWFAWQWSGDRFVAPNVELAQEEGSVRLGNKAPILVLSNGERMELGARELKLDEENGVRIEMNEGGEMRYNQDDTVRNGDVYNELNTPAQCDFSFVLADGTKVWLNAKSSLRYPVAFTGTERVVYAEGEVYLDVAPDRDHPFVVVLNDMKVEVLGTSFNVNAYKDQDFVEVTLVEGRVVAKFTDKAYELKPNKQLYYNKSNQELTLRDVDVNDYIAWKDGRYVFKGKKLEDVAHVLERWYDIKIVLTTQRAREIIFTGVVYKEEALDEFMKRLSSSSSLECNFFGQTLYIK